MSTLFKPRLAPTTIVALSLLPAFGGHAAEPEPLQRCRALVDATARLACYDALPLRAPPEPALAPAAAAAPEAQRAGAAAAAQNFGQLRKDEPEAISSHIPGVFEGWSARTRITLANGQVWQVVDDSLGVYTLKDAKVTVRRALLGGYVMDIAGANRVPRVQRLQ